MYDDPKSRQRTLIPSLIMEVLEGQLSQLLRNQQSQDISGHAEHIYRTNSFRDPQKEIPLVTIKRGDRRLLWIN